MVHESRSFAAPKRETQIRLRGSQRQPGEPEGANKHNNNHEVNRHTAPLT